jgi:hypothetical protein
VSLSRLYSVRPSGFLNLVGGHPTGLKNILVEIIGQTKEATFGYYNLNKEATFGYYNLNSS